jgi:hypothetical protein
MKIKTGLWRKLPHSLRVRLLAAEIIEQQKTRNKQ